MKAKRKMEFILLTCVFTLSFTITTFAYQLINNASSYKWSTPQNIKWNYYQQGTYDYSPSIVAACKAWEHETSKFAYSRTYGSDYNWYITSKNYGSTTWHGLTTYASKYTQINDYNYSQFAANTTELVAHELGHCNGLDDIYNDTTVLMRWQGYRGNAYPASDDINGINQLY